MWTSICVSINTDHRSVRHIRNINYLFRNSPNFAARKICRFARRRLIRCERRRRSFDGLAMRKSGSKPILFIYYLCRRLLNMHMVLRNFDGITLNVGQSVRVVSWRASAAGSHRLPDVKSFGVFGFGPELTTEQSTAGTFNVLENGTKCDTRKKLRPYCSLVVLRTVEFVMLPLFFSRPTFPHHHSAVVPRAASRTL